MLICQMCTILNLCWVFLVHVTKLGVSIVTVTYFSIISQILYVLQMRLGVTGIFKMQQMHEGLICTYALGFCVVLALRGVVEGSGRILRRSQVCRAAPLRDVIITGHPIVWYVWCS